MKKQNKIMTGLLLVTILLMGVGYAALNDVTLTITGTATASANADNFKVYFTDKVVKSDATHVTTNVVSGDDEATISFTGMDTVGQEQYAIFEIANGSDGIDAESVLVTKHDKDTDYFDIFAEMCTEEGATVSGNNPVLAGQRTYAKVTAKLKKNPLNDNTTTNIDVAIVAKPDVN